MTPLIEIKKIIFTAIDNFYKSNYLNQNPQKAMNLLEDYVDLIEHQNKITNLTNFSNEKLWVHGIYESLLVFFHFFHSKEIIWKNQKFLDVGAGVGFPSVVWKIVAPEISLHIVESRKKRVDFLKKVSQQINLSFEVIQSRIETLKGFQNYFDFLTARAVAPLEKLLLLTDGKLNTTGRGLFLKGINLKQEIVNAKNAINKLNIDYHIEKIYSEAFEYQTLLFVYNKKYVY